MLMLTFLSVSAGILPDRSRNLLLDTSIDMVFQGKGAATIEDDYMIGIVETTFKLQKYIDKDGVVFTAKVFLKQSGDEASLRYLVCPETAEDQALAVFDLSEQVRSRPVSSARAN